MNICMVGFYQYPIPPIRGGSLAIVAYELSRAFVKKGHYVSVLSVKDPLLPDYEEKEEARIRYFRLYTTPVLHSNSLFEHALSCLNYSLYTLIKIVSISTVNIVQCYDPLILPFLKVSKILQNKLAIVGFGMGGLSQGWNALRRPNWRFLSLAERVVVPSQFLKRCVVANLTIPEERVVVIPNGVNIIRFNPKFQGDEVRGKYGLGNSPVILFVGRLHPQKGVDFLLKSIPLVQKRVTDVKLLVVGPLTGGPFEERLRRLISKLRLRNVIFTGTVDVFEELPKIYAACNVFSCPSAWGEAFGNVAIEAMASGKPVVATRSGGLPEIVEDGKVGYIVPRMREKELARALIEILEDEDLQKRMGRAARKRAEESFSWDTVATRYIKLYEEVINAN